MRILLPSFGVSAFMLGSTKPHQVFRYRQAFYLSLAAATPGNSLPDEVDVVFCVPAIDIVPVVEAAKGTNIQVGAENMFVYKLI